MAMETTRTICQQCHTNCGLIVRNANGKISIKGDPGHPMNRGSCCPKAVANADIVRAKDRLHYPLLKTPTGFKRISWDEALSIAAERLNGIRSAYGPLSLARYAGAPVSYQCRDGFLQFMGEFGSPNLTGIGNLCMAPRMTAFKTVTGRIRAEPDYDNARLVLFWGSNPLAVGRFSSYAAYNGLKQIIPGLKQRGARIICIDPFETATAKRADEWVRIKPGTDTALGLAIIHVIIKEDLYDREFVARYTLGFTELAEHVRACDPHWAEGLTEIPAGKIEELARTYALTRPAAVYEGNGLDMYTNGVDAVRTIATLVCITGNLDVRGGNVFMPFPHPPVLPTNPLPIEKRVWYETFPLSPQTPFPGIKEALIRGEDNRPRAMIVHHANPVLTQANEKRTREALEKLDFLIACDIFPTATTQIAHLVLPMASDFESYGSRGYSSIDGGFLALGRPIAEPAGEARSVFEVEYELAKRMSFHRDYPFQDDQTWIDFMVKPSGVTFDRLHAEQIVYMTPKVQYQKYLNSGFDTPSGKVEFYSRRFGKMGAGLLPAYADPAGEPLPSEVLAAKGFSLLGTSHRPTQFVHTKFRNLAKIARSYPEPLIHIHPEDASARGINAGDEVDVTSPQGRITLRATVTDGTRPGLVWIDFGWGNPTDGMANINLLVNDQYFDPVSGGTPNRLFPCEVMMRA